MDCRNKNKRATIFNNFFVAFFKINSQHFIKFKTLVLHPFQESSTNLPLLFTVKYLQIELGLNVLFQNIRHIGAAVLKFHISYFNSAIFIKYLSQKLSIDL